MVQNSFKDPESDYTKEELENVMALVNAVKRIRQELRDEGIPIDEYEALLKTDYFLIE